MPKVVNGSSPDYLSEMFTNVNETHHYNLRNSNLNLKITVPKTEYMKRSLIYSGATLWNSLPSTVKQSTSVNSFINQMKVTELTVL